MDDWLTAGVKEVEASEDLTTPAANHLRLDGFQTTHIPSVRVCTCACVRIYEHGNYKLMQIETTLIHNLIDNVTSHLLIIPCLCIF